MAGGTRLRQGLAQITEGPGSNTGQETHLFTVDMAAVERLAEGRAASPALMVVFCSIFRCTCICGRLSARARRRWRSARLGSLLSDCGQFSAVAGVARSSGLCDSAHCVSFCKLWGVVLDVVVLQAFDRFVGPAAQRGTPAAISRMKDRGRKISKILFPPKGIVVILFVVAFMTDANVND